MEGTAIKLDGILTLKEDEKRVNPTPSL